jgi:hypothetical protein
MSISGDGDTVDSPIFTVPSSWALGFSVDCYPAGGRGNFVVVLHNADGSYRSLLVNIITSTAAKKTLVTTVAAWFSWR